jgi:hypothetical protein
MKRFLIFVLTIAVVPVFCEDAKVASGVVHVATALDHLTVLEFGEPVTMAAAGSQAFQIERHEDKVFIKPLKAGASTDLFVWTASRRFTYELESPGEVTQMNFAIDNSVPAPEPAPDTSSRLNEIADMMLTRAFLGAEPVDSHFVKDSKDGVTVRIEHVYESRNTLYVHYKITNRGGRPYRVLPPAVERFNPAKPGISLKSLEHTQLSHSVLRKLGSGEATSCAIAHFEVAESDLGPGESTHGIVAVRQKPESPSVLELSFGVNDKNAVEAFVVL